MAAAVGRPRKPQAQRHDPLHTGGAEAASPGTAIMAAAVGARLVMAARLPLRTIGKHAWDTFSTSYCSSCWQRPCHAFLHQPTGCCAAAGWAPRRHLEYALHGSRRSTLPHAKAALKKRALDGCPSLHRQRLRRAGKGARSAKCGTSTACRTAELKRNVPGDTVQV